MQLTNYLLNMPSIYFMYFWQFKVPCFISVGQAFFERFNCSAAWSQRMGVSNDVVTMQQNSQSFQNILCPTLMKTWELRQRICQKYTSLVFQNGCSDTEKVLHGIASRLKTNKKNARSRVVFT